MTHEERGPKGEPMNIEQTTARIQDALEFWTARVEAHPDPNDEGAPNRRRELMASQNQLRSNLAMCRDSLSALGQCGPALADVRARQNALEAAKDRLAQNLAAAEAAYERAARESGCGHEYERLREKWDVFSEMLVQAEKTLEYARTRRDPGGVMADQAEKKVEYLRGEIVMARYDVHAIMAPGLRQLGREVQELEEALTCIETGSPTNTLTPMLARELPEEYVAKFRTLRWCANRGAELTAQHDAAVARAERAVHEAAIRDAA